MTQRSLASSQQQQYSRIDSNVVIPQLAVGFFEPYFRKKKKQGVGNLEFYFPTKKKNRLKYSKLEVVSDL